MPLCWWKEVLRLGQRWPNAEWFGVVFDAPGGTFRDKVDPLYKANRPGMPDELRSQFSLAHDALAAMDVACIIQRGLEGDDLMATYARQVELQGGRSTLVTADKDMMQLVSPHCDMYSPLKKVMLGEADVVQKFGVLPEKVVQVQALCGDPTDGIIGVRGVGVKTASKLIQEHGTVEAVLKAAQEGAVKGKLCEKLTSPESIANVAKALQLVKLVQDAELDVPLEELRRKKIDRTKLSAWLYEHEFGSVLRPGGKKLFF